MNSRAVEEPLYPDLPIVDSQHHLVDKVSDAVAPVLGVRTFLIDDYVAYIGNDHSVVASVAVEGRAMYRAAGQMELRCVGETEFLNGQAAMAASGLYGPCLVAAGIVGHVDFRIDSKVRKVVEQHVEAAPHRFKGVRQSALWDADPTILGGLFDCGEGLYRDESFLNGFRHFAPLGLIFEAFVLSPQLPDVVALAHDFPDTQIVLNHMGQPVGVGIHSGQLGNDYADWRQCIVRLASCENVVVKLGGLGSYLFGPGSFRADPPASSETLAAEWRPYVEAAIEEFGADRCMFESNRPTDDTGCFGTLCNAYKRMTATCSEDERSNIAGTASRIYRLGIEELVHREI